MFVAESESPYSKEAFSTHGPESIQFKYFRNMVNRERKAFRAR